MTAITDSSDIDALKAEIRSLEDEVKKLREAARSKVGNSARTFIGEGNRQYLTGLNLGGRHIAILLDTSSSMLADKLVQIIRLRNMDPNIQRQADKWTRSLNTVDWLTAQLPVGSKYQVIAFNTEARPALPGTEGKWLEVANQAQLEQVSGELRKITPSGGTSLENAFLALQRTVTCAGQYLPDYRRPAHPGQHPTPGQQGQRPDRQKLYRARRSSSCRQRAG